MVGQTSILQNEANFHYNFNEQFSYQKPSRTMLPLLGRDSWTLNHAEHRSEGGSEAFVNLSLTLQGKAVISAITARFAMANLVIFSGLVGAVLAMRLGVLALVPAVLFALIAIPGFGIAIGAGLWPILSAVLSSVCVLQFGYLAGSAIRVLMATTNSHGAASPNNANLLSALNGIFARGIVSRNGLKRI